MLIFYHIVNGYTIFFLNFVLKNEGISSYRQCFPKERQKEYPVLRQYP